MERYQMYHWFEQESVNSMSEVDPVKYCNQLNEFYARFDKSDFSDVRNNTVGNIESSSADCPVPKVTQAAVKKAFKNIKVNKAAGPDSLFGKVLYTCLNQLSNVFQRLYQKSLVTYSIPSQWKLSHIVLLPKNNSPSCNNDYRPIALT